MARLGNLRAVRPGAPGSGLRYPGLGLTSAPRFFPDIQSLTFDFQLPIPARYFFVSALLRRAGTPEQIKNN